MISSTSTLPVSRGSSMHGYYIGPDLAALFASGPTDAALPRMCDVGGDALHRYVVDNTPIKTGNLRTSWYRVPAKPSFGSKVRWRTTVRTNVDYAKYVNYGTGLWGPEHRKYLIAPKAPGGTLSWVDPLRGRVFAKHVWHPGSPGQYMVESGAAKLEVTVQDVLQPELERWKIEQEALVLAAAARVEVS